MFTLSEWEINNFFRSSFNPAVVAVFPSREIYFSADLLRSLRLDSSACPKTLDQWYELCHPENHSVISKLENSIYGHENEISITRKLYCGDGIYRTFRLDAFIIRSQKGKPEKLIGFETSALNAWISEAKEGDKIIINDKIFEAVDVHGVMTLRDLDLIGDFEDENLRLRHEIFSHYRPLKNLISEPESSWEKLFDILEKNVTEALDVLSGNIQLKALLRSIYDDNIIVGVAGLPEGGKSLFVNALLGERLIPEGMRVPIFCTEGETRTAKVIYQDGHSDFLKGSKLTASFLKNLKDLSRIELTIPGALIPQGICITYSPSYTPSMNAVKNILPEFDVIIYATPVSERLTELDREFLRLISAVNENLIFALTGTDLEYDDTEAGKIIRTAGEKISKSIKAIKSEFPFEVMPISSENALKKFYDRNSEAWKFSNFSLITEYLTEISKQAFVRALKMRLKRALRILERTEFQNWKILDIEQNIRRALSELKTEDETVIKLPDTKISTVRKTEGSLLFSLITSMKEREFKTKFFSLKAFNGNRKAILLGADEFRSIRLYSRLLHNAGIEEKLETDKWLKTSGVTEIEGTEIPSTGSGEQIIIVPSDGLIKEKIDWRRIFENYVPVISIGFQIEKFKEELIRAPYYEELKGVRSVIAFEDVRNEGGDFTINELEADIFLWRDYTVNVKNS